MKRKRILSVVMATTVLTSVFVGCGTNKGSEEAKGNDVVQLRIAQWGDINSATVEKQIIEEFNNAHENINVTLEMIPEGYGDKIMAGLAAGSAPDVFLVGEGDFTMFTGKGVTENLNTYIEKDSSFNVDIYEKNLMEYNTINNEVHYLTKDFNPIALWYNKDLFDEAGVEYPNDSWTWDDLVNNAKKLTKDKDADGKLDQYGFFASTWDYNVLAYAEANGAKLSNEDATKADGYINSEKTIQVIQDYVDLILKENISPSADATASLGGETSMFMTGNLAMMISGRWVKGDFDKGEINYGSSLIPQGTDSRAGVICAAGFTMNNKSKHKEEAWELLKWVTGERASELRSKDGHVLPAITSQLEEVKNTEVEDKAVIEMMNYAIKPFRLLSDNGAIFGEKFGQAMEKITLGKATVSEALNEAAKEIDKAIDEK